MVNPKSGETVMIPYEDALKRKAEYAKRDIWTADMIRAALDECRDSKLYVAMNLSFACSLRMGEIKLANR